MIMALCHQISFTVRITFNITNIDAPKYTLYVVKKI